MYRRPNLVPRSPTAKGKGKQSEIWVRDYRRPPPSGNIGRVSPLDFFSGRKDVCTRPIISPAFAKLTENWVNWVIGCSNKTRLVLLHTVYSRLADTLLIRTPRLCGQEPFPPPPAKCIKKWLWQTPIPVLRTLAITEMRTLSCPQGRDFTCFFSRYRGHSWILRQKSGLIGWCEILYQLISREKRLVFHPSPWDCHVITVSGCLILTAVNSSSYRWLTKC